MNRRLVKHPEQRSHVERDRSRFERARGVNSGTAALTDQMLARTSRFVATLFLLLLGSAFVCAQGTRGVVVDQTNLPLPGVRIELVRDDRVVDVLVTEADGTFELPAFQPGDRLDAILDGFETAKVLPGDARRITMVVGRTTEVTEVVASALTSSGAAMERLGSTMSAPLAQRLPTPRPHILQALPLLPSVIRGRDGQLRIGGTRPHESSLWIDGFDVTDPVTGTTAIDLPDESVKGMAVLRDPISATFSGVLGSLASIETATGGETFKGGVQGFIPRPRLSGLGLGRIEAFFPRAYASGRAGAVRYFGSVEFNFERVPVPGVTESSGNPNTGATGITSFARADIQLSPRHSLTLEALFAPVHTSNADLSPLRGPETAPQIDSQDFFAGLVDRVVLNPSDLLTIRLGMLDHQTTIEPAGTGAALLTPTGWSQNWFASADTSGLRQSLSITWDRSTRFWIGTHALSVSTDLRHREMTSTVAHQSIRIEDSQERLVRQIDFGPSAELQADDLLGGLGLRDLWDMTAHLQLDLGARIDWGLRRERPTFSPRFGLRYRLDEEGRTTIKGSAGLFVGRAPLGALAFGQFPKRMETTFDPATGQAIHVDTLTPMSTTLVLPRATGVALELEHQIRHGLEAQLSVRQRLGSSLPTVDVPAAGGFVPLTHSGTSTYREFQVSVHQTWRDDRQLFLSYVRSSSKAEVNDFGSLFVNLDAPLLEPAGTAPTSTDVPHRVRGWATFGLISNIVVSPSVDWRTGFPYSVQDVYRHYVGEPNSERFPDYFAADVTVYKTFDIRSHKADLGLQFFNVTSHFNPRDVIAVNESSQFGTLTNSFGLTLGGYMQVRWR
jgi:hypothetical protein